MKIEATDNKERIEIGINLKANWLSGLLSSFINNNAMENITDTNIPSPIER